MTKEEFEIMMQNREILRQQLGEEGLRRIDAIEYLHEEIDEIVRQKRILVLQIIHGKHQVALNEDGEIDLADLWDCLQDRKWTDPEDYQNDLDITKPWTKVSNDAKEYFAKRT